jgi:hypothetical protein
MSDPENSHENEESELIRFTEKARKGDFTPIRETDLLYVRQNEMKGYTDYGDDHYIYGIS